MSEDRGAWSRLRNYKDWMIAMWLTAFFIWVIFPESGAVTLARFVKAYNAEMLK